VRTGALGVTVAQEIARSTEEEQRAALLNRAEQGERLRVRDVKPPARVPDAPLGEHNFQQAAADAAPTEIENNFHPAARAPWPAHVTRPSPLAKTTTTISLPRVTATHVTPSETVRPFRQMSRYLRRRRGCALRMCDRLSYSRLAMAVRTWTSYGPPCGPTWKPWAGRYGMAYLFAADSGDPTPAHVTLTTDHVTADDAGPLAEALHTAGVAVERHTFLPARDDEAHPWGVLLLAASGPPLPLAHLVAPATAPAGVAPALAAALGSGSRSAPATLQLKADGVFVSIRGRVLIDITTALDVLPAQLARLDTRREERRLVYAEGAWRIDP